MGKFAAIAPALSTIGTVASAVGSISSLAGGSKKSSGPAPVGPAPTTGTDSIAQEAERKRREAAANAMGRGATIATTPFNQQIAGAVQRKSLMGE